MTPSKNQQQVLLEAQRVEFMDGRQEAAVVTAMIWFPEYIDEVIKVIPTELVFQNEHLRVVYENICEVHREGADVTEMSVQRHLRSNGKFMAIKKSGWSLQLDQMTPNDEEEIIAAAEGLVSMYRRQMAYNFSQSMYSKLMTDSTDAEIASDLFDAYESMTLMGGRSAEKTSKDAAYGALKLIEENIKKRKLGMTSGIPTGSYKLDRLIGGWQNDEVIIISARPAQAKTGLLLYTLLHAAEAGYPVGIFSLEMDSEHLNFRLAALKSGIEYSDMIKGEIDESQWIKIETALSEIAKLPIYYYDDMSIKNVEKVDQVATDWCRKRGVKIIGIDYIQYLRTKVKGTTVEQISAVSMAIKSMQRTLKIPVIALAQLGRDVDKRANPRPQLDDLKESGQLEQDASTVIGLFYPTTYLRKGLAIEDEIESKNGMSVPFPDRAYCLYLLKTRSGAGHKRVDLYVDLGTNRFSDTNVFDRPQGLIPLNNTLSLFDKPIEDAF